MKRLSWLAWLVLALPASVAGQAQPVRVTFTPPQFAQRLNQLADEISKTEPASAVRVCASVPGSVQVDNRSDRDGSRRYDMSFDWLRRDLCDATSNQGAWPTRRGEIAARLRAMSREAASAQGAGQPAAVAARATLDQILAQRSFRRVRSESWQAAMLRRLGDWFTDFWQSTFGRRLGQRRAAELLAWVVAMAAALVLVVWLVRFASRERRERPTSMGSIDGPRLPGHVLGVQAAELIRAGNIREGARVAYRAAVARLEEEGALRVDDARTPRESLKLLSPGHRRRAPLASLTAIFERVWYGWRGQDRSAGDAILALLEELECGSFDRAK